MFFCQARHL